MFLGTCGERQAGDGAEGAEKIWRKLFYVWRQTIGPELRETFNISTGKNVIERDFLIYCSRRYPSCS